MLFDKNGQRIKNENILKIVVNMFFFLYNL